jgi:hypothetical protein
VAAAARRQRSADTRVPSEGLRRRHVRSISAAELVSRLDDELYALNERLGETTFPKAAKAYLDDWAAPANGWLRKYYPAGSDDVHFDAELRERVAALEAENAELKRRLGMDSTNSSKPPSSDSPYT